MKLIVKIATAFVLTGLLLGCNLSPAPAPTLAPTSALNPTITEALPGDIPFTFGNVSLVIPAGLASGITAQTSTDPAYPYIYSEESMPEHTIIDLTGYALSGEGGTIIIFKADEFAGYSEKDSKMIAALQSLPDQAPFPDDLLSNFHAREQVLSGPNGRGLRYLHQIMQGFAAIDNQSLFYYYAGLTADGAYFVQALLPIHVECLAAESGATPPPACGVPFPAGQEAPAAMPDYLQAVKDQLDAGGRVFTPSLADLDDLVKSIQVTP